jgi:hypothetical protein
MIVLAFHRIITIQLASLKTITKEKGLVANGNLPTVLEVVDPVH